MRDKEYTQVNAGNITIIIGNWGEGEQIENRVTGTRTAIMTLL